MATPIQQPGTLREADSGTHAAASTRIILQYPDITLKGKNQKEFQDVLYLNIKRHMQSRGYDWRIGASHGRASIIVPEQQRQAAAEAAAILQKMPGVHSLAVAAWLHPAAYRPAAGGLDWRNIEREIITLARQTYQQKACFAVHVHRTDKSLPATSSEIATRLGDVIRRHSDWDIVRLNRPDRTFYVDIHPDGMYLYADKLKGVGGLPVGTGGRVLALLSGGIDSPVAAFQLARRGCQVDFFHLSASHMPRQELINSVIGRLAAQLSRYTQHSRLYAAPYTYFDLALAGSNSGYELVLFRRFMMRTAETLAQKIHARALVNGDSLGQVASQTLDNLVSSTRVISMPLFRPLIGSNKEEIIETARRLGSYDISIEPYKDCCALIARHPKTRSSHNRLAELEDAQLPGYAALIDRTLADMVCLEYRFGELQDE